MDDDSCTNFVDGGFQKGDKIYVSGSFWKRLWQRICKKPRTSGHFIVTDVTSSIMSVKATGSK